MSYSKRKVSRHFVTFAFECPISPTLSNPYISAYVHCPYPASKALIIYFPAIYPIVIISLKCLLVILDTSKYLAQKDFSLYGGPDVTSPALAYADWSGGADRTFKRQSDTIHTNHSFQKRPGSNCCRRFSRVKRNAAMPCCATSSKIYEIDILSEWRPRLYEILEHCSNHPA